MGWDYSKAFEQYKKDKFGDAETLEEFIEDVHEQFYDDDVHFIRHSILTDIYGHLVFETKLVISGEHINIDGSKIKEKL